MVAHVEDYELNAAFAAFVAENPFRSRDRISDEYVRDLLRVVLRAAARARERQVELAPEPRDMTCCICRAQPCECASGGLYAMAKRLADA